MRIARLQNRLVAFVVISAATTSLRGDGPWGNYDHTVTFIQAASCGIFGEHRIYVHDFNESGLVVGEFRFCAGGSSGQAFRWTAETGFELLPNSGAQLTYSIARAVNEAGLAAGEWDGSNTVAGFTGMMWGGGPVASDLPPVVPPGTNSVAHDINESGVAVGWWGNTSVGPSPMPCRWVNGEIEDLTRATGGQTGEAKAINDLGDIVGGHGHTILTTTAWRLTASGEFTELGALPGGFNASASGINNFGTIVGTGVIAIVVHRGFVMADGPMELLEPQPGFLGTQAWCVNDLGLIGGVQTIPSNNSDRACVWRDGIAHPLQPLIDPSEQYLAFQVVAIDARGRVLCHGAKNGIPVGILLEPKDVIPGDLSIDGSVNGTDLDLFLKAWPLQLPWADIDGDGAVDGRDLGRLLAAWTG